MKLENAIKKLATVGAVTKVDSRYSTTIGNYVVSFYANSANTKASGFKVSRIGDRNDTASDYSAGTHCANLTQAINLANSI